MMELYNENEAKAYKAYQKAQYDNEVYAIKEYLKAISEFKLTDGYDGYAELHRLQDQAERLKQHADAAIRLFPHVKG